MARNVTTNDVVLPHFSAAVDHILDKYGRMVDSARKHRNAVARAMRAEHEVKVAAAKVMTDDEFRNHFDSDRNLYLNEPTNQCPRCGRRD